MLVGEVGHRPDIGADAGGGLGVDHEHRDHAALEQPFAHRVERHALAERCLEEIDLATAARDDVREASRERAVHHRHDLARSRTADCSFHHAGGGRRADEHRLGGPEYSLQSRLKPCIQRLECRTAMRHHGLQHRLQHLGAHLGGAREEETTERVAHPITSDSISSKLATT